MLWIADETGAYEPLQPGGGYNGRTREPGEPDWWVVAKEPGWTPDAKATQEHLDHIDRLNGFGDAVSTIGSGVGEAVSKGAAGAGEAFGKTWNALTTNEDRPKGVKFGAKAEDAQPARGGTKCHARATAAQGADTKECFVRAWPPGKAVLSCCQKSRQRPDEHAQQGARP